DRPPFASAHAEPSRQYQVRSATSCAYFANDGGVFANLVTQLLIHPYDQGVRRLDVGEGGLDAATNLCRRADAPTRRQHLVNKTRLARCLNDAEHPWRI